MTENKKPFIFFISREVSNDLPALLMFLFFGIKPQDG